MNRKQFYNKIGIFVIILLFLVGIVTLASAENKAEKLKIQYISDLKLVPPSLPIAHQDLLNEIKKNSNPLTRPTDGKKTGVLFHDDFEDGDWLGWVDLGQGVKEVTNATAGGSSQYSFHEYNSPADHDNGVVQTVGPIWPNYVSLYIRSGSTTEADVYFVPRSSLGGFPFWVYANNNGEISIGSLTWEMNISTYNAHEWYFVEFANINWDNKTFDFYLDNNLIQQGLVLEADDFYDIFLYNFDQGSEGWWDEIWVEGGSVAPPIIEIDPPSFTFTVPPGGADVATLTIFNTAPFDHENLHWNIFDHGARLIMQDGQELPVEVQLDNNLTEYDIFSKKRFSKTHSTRPGRELISKLNAGLQRSAKPVNEEKIAGKDNYSGTKPRYEIPRAAFERVNKQNDLYSKQGESFFFPATGDVYSISGGAGYWFNAGDCVEGNRTLALSSVSHIEYTLEITYNVLQDGASCDLDLAINGVWVGSFQVFEGENIKNLVFDFPPIPGPSYTILLEETNTIPVDDGSIGIDPDLSVMTFDDAAEGCGWLSENPTAGVIAPGDKQFLDINVEATGLVDGIYYCELVIESNDLNDPMVFVPVTLVVGEGGEKKVLWDLTHGVYLDYTPHGFYSDMTGFVQSSGFNIVTTNDIGSENLADYCLVVCGLGSAWDIPYTAAEKAQIQSYVQNGGGLLIMGDNSTVPNGNINPISEAFGVTCGLSEIGPNDLYFSNLAVHPVFENVNNLFFRAAGELAVTPPAQEIAWTDNGEVIVAAAQDGAGRVLVTGDLNFCENDYFGMEENHLFILNIFEWLCASVTDCNPPYVRAEDAYGVSGSHITVNIILEDNPDPVDAIGFNFEFCADKLTFVEAKRGNLNEYFNFFEGIEESPGFIKIGGFDPNAFPAHSNGTIAQLVFYVDNCQIGEICDLCVFDLVDDIAGLNACCGIFGCEPGCLLGDVNMDGAITPGDALCAFKIYLNGGTPPPDDCDTECAMYAADLNCAPNGVTPGDALYIFLGYLAGDDPPLDCDPSGLSSGIAGLQLRLNQTSGCPGEEITIPVKVDNQQGLKSFGFDLGYPDELLTFVEVTASNMTKEWQALDGKENIAGTVTIGGYHSEAINSSNTDVLLEVTFKVKDGAAGCGDLWFFNLTDDAVKAKINTGTFSTATSAIRKIGNQDTPTTFALEQNYPNPFNMETEIVYQIPEDVYVRLTIYNSLGHKIRTLISRSQSVGRYAAHWDGKDESGHEITSGIYIYRLETSKFNDVKKMLLVK
jgi:hypothetical protein